MQAHADPSSTRTGGLIPAARGLWSGVGWPERLLLLAVVLLPFQQALTLEIGFPLKASELLGGVGVVWVAVRDRGGLLRARGSILILALAGLVVVSSLWTVFAGERAGGGDAYPHGLIFDLVQYTGYALFALALYLAVASTLTADQLSTAIAWAVRLAALYVVVQLVVWAFGASGLLEALLNGTTQLGSQYGVPIPRNGPLREGNYLGFFAVTVAMIAYRARDRWTLGIGLFLVLYSQSTVALLGIAAAGLAMVVLRPSRLKLIVGGAVLAIGAAAAVALPPVTRFITGQLTKLGLIPNTLGPAYEYSLRSRSANADAGFAMALDHPLLGVGQGRYALHYADYLDPTGLPEGFADRYVRPIANNVYAQLAAETGWLALLLLIALLGWLAWWARKESDGALGLVAAVAVGLIAFPAWTNLMVWVVLAAAAVFTRTVGSPAALKDTPDR